MPLARGVTGLAQRLLAPFRFRERDVYVLFMEYTAEHRRTAWEVLVPFVERLFPGHRTRYVVIDNAHERDEDVPPQPGADAIAGDPSSREFSGLDAGIAHVRRRYAPGPGAIFVLLNDTFHRSYGADYLEAFRRRTVRSALVRGQAVGYVDCYPGEIEVLGLPLRCWIRTSAVLVSARTLEAIGKLALPVPDEELFDGVDRFFRTGAPLSDNYQAYLRGWLLGEEVPGFRQRWHSAQALTAENLAAFRAKARAIICEHYLSARLRALDIPVSRVKRRR